VRKSYRMITTMLFALLMLSACREPKKNDLFKQMPEEDTLAQTERAALAADLAPEDQSTSSKKQLSKQGQTVIGKQLEDGEQREEKMPESIEQMPEEKRPMSAKQSEAEIQSRNAQQTADDNRKADTGQTDGKKEAFSQSMIDSFYYEELTDEIKERINGKSYGKNCDVPYEELRYVKVLHYGFDGEIHEGELIVNQAIAQDVVDIFKELYEEKYPIERMVLVDDYDADDNASMAANNSSAFNYRVIEGTNRTSFHGYGLAIDINPLYNPYVRKDGKKTVVTPENGARYEDRNLDCEYYIKKGDACYQAFVKRGFTWGGDWKSKKDYQHFQKSLEDTRTND
jgi:hypothetical protein